LDVEAALVPALAEGLERYSAAVFRNEQFIWATAKSLGDEALNLDNVPRCTATELAHPKCPLVLPNKTKQIRWVKALSVLDRRVVYLPAVMVYSHVGYAVPEERFWFQISTGCAAHVSYERALVAGIYEVLERDAISITWLQKLSLPKIEIDCIPPSLAPYWERYMKASADLEYLFFDATTDLGVPTVYALQIATADSRVTTLVACATGPTIGRRHS
jgi:ribosomal protein S12 methylthiotransferase accessory factor